ncbi:hypothetical protein PCH_Pc24g02500 [Penicillium rubens Wisconsin 54-1255]|uniref:Uncharacterized protein n=1 Tax=Penicillium rubens (strain ATCC 28089 / DSM 1075 / NRRL 1951 / Wisconsin 54-1255) TaxID=500485 RepID=B6HX28_PENRW|nr:hypothetical protein PCH_Pc24g02500 [Penicillium rubens Wisconsin 54-1255]
MPVAVPVAKILVPPSNTHDNPGLIRWCGLVPGLHQPHITTLCHTFPHNITTHRWAQGYPAPNLQYAPNYDVLVALLAVLSLLILVLAKIRPNASVIAPAKTPIVNPPPSAGYHTWPYQG